MKHEEQYDVLLKKKKEYKQAAVGVTVLLAVIALTITVNFNGSIEQKAIVAEKPEFKKSTTPKHRQYWVEIKFKDSVDVYKIWKTEYWFLIPEFKDNIIKGDTVEVLAVDKIIYKLSKRGRQYINLSKAQESELRWFFIVLSLYVYFIAFCLWISSIEKIPSFSYNGKSYKIKIDLIFISLLITIAIILNYLIGNG